MADLTDVSQEQVYDIVRLIFKEITTGNNEMMSNFRELIESYLREYRRKEPFDGIPTETRIHLERLSLVMKKRRGCRRKSQRGVSL